jgi:hypothetical protein
MKKKVLQVQHSMLDYNTIEDEQSVEVKIQSFDSNQVLTKEKENSIFLVIR